MAAAVLPVVVVGVVVLGGISQDPLVGADYGLLELGTRDAWRGDMLVGPYSRTRWNHLGPAVWYWFGPFYAAAGQRTGGLALAAVTLNLVGLGWSMWAVARTAGQAAGWAAAAVALAFTAQTGTSWIDQPWNPLMVIVPLVVAGVGTAGVVAGRRWHLVAGASFAIQTHVGALPVAGPFVAITAVAVVIHLVRSRQGWIRPGGIAAGAGALLWSAPVYEQLTREPGNLGLFVSYSRRPPGSHGLGDVFDVIGAHLTLVHSDLVHQLLIGGGVAPPGAEGSHLVAIIALLTAAAVATVANVVGRRPFEAALCGAPLLGVAASTVSLMRLDGVLGRYLALPVLALGFLLYLGLALTVVAVIRTGVRRPLPPAVAPIVAAGVSTLSLIVASQEVRADHAAFPFSRLGGEVEGAEGAMAAIDAAAPDGRPVHVILSDRSTIGEATVVVNRLERAGTEVTVPPEWAFVFGERVGPRCPGVIATFHELDPAKRREQPAPTSETRTTTALAQAYVTVADAGPTPDCPP
ncbi:hypothetical protein [Iamia sp.]|uniref:hypothetical protein n=1 Tax=Iamia sp. TaxID=2722710 RepID=UPI002BD0241F|nr:hypothetical protein [Iamia sp.]HXH57292.1 hypothetical protein [Iamia sp.]